MGPLLDNVESCKRRHHPSLHVKLGHPKKFVVTPWVGNFACPFTTGFTHNLPWEKESPYCFNGGNSSTAARRLSPATAKRSSRSMAESCCRPSGASPEQFFSRFFRAGNFPHLARLDYGFTIGWWEDVGIWFKTWIPQEGRLWGFLLPNFRQSAYANCNTLLAS